MTAAQAAVDLSKLGAWAVVCGIAAVLAGLAVAELTQVVPGWWRSWRRAHRDFQAARLRDVHVAWPGPPGDPSPKPRPGLNDAIRSQFPGYQVSAALPYFVVGPVAHLDRVAVYAVRRRPTFAERCADLVRRDTLTDPTR